MQKAINDAISAIDKEIADLTARKNTLQSINTSNLSNTEKWCLLRETPLREDRRGMTELAKMFIPGADEYIYDVNEIRIRMGLISVSIPTSNTYDINFFYNGTIIHKYPEIEEPTLEETKLKGYLNLLEVGASNWTLMKYYAPTKSNLYRLFLIAKNKNKMRNVEDIISRYNKLKNDRYAKNKDLFDAYITFSNEVSKFDALMYDKIKAFAGNKFRIQRNGVYY